MSASQSLSEFHSERENNVLTPQLKSNTVTCHVSHFEQNMNEDSACIPNWVTTRLALVNEQPIKVCMPLLEQEVCVAKQIDLDCCTTITSSKVNQEQILTALNNYRVLYNSAEVDLWIDGVIYRFVTNFFPNQAYSCYYQTNSTTTVTIKGILKNLQTQRTNTGKHNAQQTQNSTIIDSQFNSRNTLTQRQRHSRPITGTKKSVGIRLRTKSIRSCEGESPMTNFTQSPRTQLTQISRPQTGTHPQSTVILKSETSFKQSCTKNTKSSRPHTAKQTLLKPERIISCNRPAQDVTSIFLDLNTNKGAALQIKQKQNIHKGFTKMLHRFNQIIHDQHSLKLYSQFVDAEPPLQEQTRLHDIVTDPLLQTVVPSQVSKPSYSTLKTLQKSFFSPEPQTSFILKSLMPKQQIVISEGTSTFQFVEDQNPQVEADNLEAQTTELHDSTLQKTGNKKQENLQSSTLQMAEDGQKNDMRAMQKSNGQNDPKQSKTVYRRRQESQRRNDQVETRFLEMHPGDNAGYSPTNQINGIQVKLGRSRCNSIAKHKKIGDMDSERQKSANLKYFKEMKQIQLQEKNYKTIRVDRLATICSQSEEFMLASLPSKSPSVKQSSVAYQFQHRQLGATKIQSPFFKRQLLKRMY